MAIFDFFLSRNNAASTPQNYIGHKDRLFYNSEDGVIKLSDGVTPGGLSIPYTIASTSTIGGIRGGPGVTINSEGQLLIDSAGLEFSFGDLQGTVGTYAVGHPNAGEDYALLSSIKANEDIILASNGIGAIKILGELSVHATDGNLDDELLREPIFRVQADGQIRMLVPDADITSGALEIIGNNSGEFHPPNQTGVIMHVTGNSGQVSRNYFDSNNNYVVITGRRYNGTASSVTRVLAGETILRVVGQASTDLGFQPFGPGRIDFRTTEDQYVGAQGGEIAFYVTNTGTSATNAIEILQLNAETGVTTRNVTPQIDETYDLGSPARRWANVYIGKASLFMSDQTTGASVEITVDDGTLLIDGVASLSIGSMRITNNTLTTVDPADDIKFGLAGDTGKIDATNRAILATNITSTGTISATTGTFTRFSGFWNRSVRNAGTIADGGTLTIDFATDTIVYCTWGNGMTLAYQNYTAGSIVKIVATKATGTGVDAISLDGVIAAHVSNGLTTTPNAAADTTVFIELMCVGTTISDVYVKL